MTETSVARVLRAAGFPEREKDLPARESLFCGMLYILRAVWDETCPSEAAWEMASLCTSPCSSGQSRDPLKNSYPDKDYVLKTAGGLAQALWQ